MNYLMIENPGVADEASFSLLGASNKVNSDRIGCWGSGTKFSIALCLRNDLPLTIFADKLKLEFFGKSKIVDQGFGGKEHKVVQMKFGGKDRTGKSKSETKELGFTVDYGSKDWTDISLALREFVSNSFDRAEDEGDYNFSLEYIKKNPNLNKEWAEWTDKEQESFIAARREANKRLMYFKNVNVKIVEESNVRAKSGNTRVFIPCNEKVLQFFGQLPKWFLHFNEPELLYQSVLPKKSRNLKEGKYVSVIYRRGVRVREIENSDKPGLFDYNLENLQLNESRTVDDFKVAAAVGQVLRDADVKTVSTYIGSFRENGKYWEHTAISEYYLKPTWGEADNVVEVRNKTWQKAVENTLGENGVVAPRGGGEIAARKGFKVLELPESIFNGIKEYDLKTPDKVLSADEKELREIFEPTIDTIKAVDYIWSHLEELGMTRSREKPAVKCFRQLMTGEGKLMGFYRNDTVFINLEFLPQDGSGIGSFSDDVWTTFLEEIGHHVTLAADFSRDLQDFVLNLVVKLLRRA